MRIGRPLHRSFVACSSTAASPFLSPFSHGGGVGGSLRTHNNNTHSKSQDKQKIIKVKKGKREKGNEIIAASQRRVGRGGGAAQESAAMHAEGSPACICEFKAPECVRETKAKGARAVPSGPFWIRRRPTLDTLFFRL